jgi:hypothetical protein
MWWLPPPQQTAKLHNHILMIIQPILTFTNNGYVNTVCVTMFLESLIPMQTHKNDFDLSAVKQ